MTGYAPGLPFAVRLPDAEGLWWIAAARMVAALLVLLPLLATDAKLIDGASR